MKRSRRLLIECLANISYPTKTIEEKMQEQERPTVPAPSSKDEAKMYQDLLNMIRSDKKTRAGKRTRND